MVRDPFVDHLFQDSCPDFPSWPSKCLCPRNRRLPIVVHFAGRRGRDLCWFLQPGHAIIGYKDKPLVMNAGLAPPQLNLKGSCEGFFLIDLFPQKGVWPKVKIAKFTNWQSRH